MWVCSACQTRASPGWVGEDASPGGLKKFLLTDLNDPRRLTLDPTCFEPGEWNCWPGRRPSGESPGVRRFDQLILARRQDVSMSHSSLSPHVSAGSDPIIHSGVSVPATHSTPLAAAMTSVANPAHAAPIPLLDINRTNVEIRDEILELWTQAYDQGGFIGGPHIKNLESTLAETCQVPHAIACASGSDALLLALMAIGVEPGDEVIVPAFTFFATASAVWRLGATPVFADIDPQTFNMDAKHVRSLINNHTKAIIPVHLFGLACDMDEYQQICESEDLWLIEDCAQSIGARHRDRAVGSIGDMGCFSFYPSKNLGGFGDGGFMTAREERLAKQLRVFANHGMTEVYNHEYVGINSRLDSLQAAALWVKCRQLDALAEARRANANRYAEMFAEVGLDQVIGLPTEPTDCYHVWNQYTVRIPEGRRDSIKAAMTECKIGTAIYYPIPLNRQPCFAPLGYSEGSLPQTEQACREVLSLPVFPGLTIDEQARVVQTLHAAWHGKQSLKAAG